jgi:hypothetical protein
MQKLALAVVALLGTTSFVFAAGPNTSADQKATGGVQPRTTVRSYSYVPQQTVAPTAVVPATPAPVATAAPAAPSENAMAAAPRRAYRSYSYQPSYIFGRNTNRPHSNYFSRADDKVRGREGLGD